MPQHLQWQRQTCPFSQSPQHLPLPGTAGEQDVSHVGRVPFPWIISQDAQAACPGSHFPADSGEAVSASQGFVTAFNFPPSLVKYHIVQQLSDHTVFIGLFLLLSSSWNCEGWSSQIFSFYSFFFCITIHVYKLLIMLLAFINSKQGGKPFLTLCKW